MAKDSRALINSEGEGIVKYVDAKKITILYNKSEEEKLISFDQDEKTYLLTKFLKTNQNTCMNIRPIVKVGDKVIKDQVLCEGYNTKWRVSPWKKSKSCVYAMERL